MDRSESEVRWVQTLKEFLKESRLVCQESYAKGVERSEDRCQKYYYIGTTMMGSIVCERCIIGAKNGNLRWVVKRSKADVELIKLDLRIALRRRCLPRALPLIFVGRLDVDNSSNKALPTSGAASPAITVEAVLSKRSGLAKPSSWKIYSSFGS
ncbi:unnamed protein product [Acanthoscelides obtectus]|uniref:Uncharacterized protein n=1 Tax=Acanthoscelides obtectus TaxID=200917 RepID=A0A9P0LS49_ACAOB|nr:unnamed protein product [Acanthoscelides obtectus]CAK1641488.1 hypothetical protein AOBTE_LOCUS12438 [Acanthoscelides obtectus]